MTFQHSILVSLFITVLFGSSQLIAEESSEIKDVESMDCADPVNAAREAMKETLGPLYANGADQPQLKSAARQIDKYIADATYCRMAMQSGAMPATQSTIGEWLSLQQWLNRMADTVADGAADTGSLRWRDEYTLFAEIYEFEP